MATNRHQANLPIRPELQGILDAPKADKPRLFFEYCRKVIKDKNRGEITLEDAGYQIAGAMFIHELDEPLFEEITLLAGRLELPSHVLGTDPTTEWKQLVALVEEYGAMVRSNKPDSSS